MLSGRYTKNEEIRTRPLPEGAGALAYTPGSPTLCYLNTTAWAVFELCDGKTKGQLETEFVDFVGSAIDADVAKREMESALTMLAEKELVQISV
jgi:hypothetical protein